MDAVTIVSIIAALGGVASMVVPLLRTNNAKRARENMMISVTKDDGSTSSIKLEKVHHSISEADIKRVIELLKEVDDAEPKVSPEK